ncbi:MAG: hypothetical protein ACKO8Q_10845 [Bacteroidota bacterium]
MTEDLMTYELFYTKISYLGAMVFTQTKKFVALTCLIFLSQFTLGQFYRGSNVTYGKNRVQYKFFEWSSLSSDHFDIFYYAGGKNIASHTFRFSEKEYSRLKKFYNISFEEDIQILIFNKHTDFRQSNLGQTTDETSQLGGSTTIQGNKIFIYYEGSIAQLENQISIGISRVFFLKLMYGANWINVLKGANRIALPTWFSEGAIRFAALGEQRKALDFALDWKLVNKSKNLQRTSNEHAELIGQAFWSHVVDLYGENVMVNILNSTQFFRSTDAGFSYMIGKNTSSVIQSFLNALEANNSEDVKSALETLNLSRNKYDFINTQERLKRKYSYRQVTPSPDQKYWAYVKYDRGKYFVHLLNIETGKNKVVFKGDIRSDRIANYGFPIVTWHPSSKILAFTSEREGNPLFYTYNLDSKELNEKVLIQIDQVNSMSYSPDGKRLTMSAYFGGASDVYVLPITASKPQALTKDNFDEATPVFSKDGRKIIFSSNRGDSIKLNYPDTIFATKNNHHIYELDWERAENSELIQLSAGDFHDANPVPLASGKIQFMRKKEGLSERCSVYRDSAIAYIDTVVHYRYFNVTEVLQQLNRSVDNLVLDSSGTSISMISNSLNLPTMNVVNLLQDRALSVEGGEEIKQENTRDSLYTEMKWIPKFNDPKRIDTKNFLFPADKKKQDEELKRKESNSVVTVQNLKIPLKKDYRLNFTTDYVQSSWDNQFATDFYQNYVGPSSLNPGFSNFIRVGASDLMEDYKFTAGIRLAANFSNSDFILSFQNLQNRMDRKISLQRQNQTFSENGIYIESQTLFLNHEWLYPFNEVSSLRMTAIGRKDRIVVLGIDPVTTSYPNNNEYNLGGKLEYCYDNTYLKGLNYRTGMRFKTWAEHLRQPLNWKERTSLYVAGFDFRWYQPIHRDLIFAFRMAGASSFGEYKVVHYLGGVDNWLFQKVDNSIAVSPNQNYTYQTFAGPLRGFYVNSRNGNNFVVSNSELRLPLFRYLANKPLQSEFTDNFQIIGFFDIGSAWSGRDPYDEENDFNLISATQIPVTVEIRSNREPIIYGYGFGMRSKVLGYYMRADWAWGVDDHQVMPRVFYLSLNMDF